MPNWKKVVVSGSDASLNSLYSSGPITGSDIQIDDWGSISASLVQVQVTASQVSTLDEVVTAGNFTTGDILATNFATLTGAGYMEAGSFGKKGISSTGILFNSSDWTAFSESIDIKLGSAASPLVMYRDNSDAGFGVQQSTHAIWNDNAGDFEFLIKSSGSGASLQITSTGPGEENTTATFGGQVVSTDISIDDWGSVSASLVDIQSGVGALSFQAVTDTGNTTTNDIEVEGTITVGTSGLVSSYGRNIAFNGLSAGGYDDRGLASIAPSYFESGINIPSQNVAVGLGVLGAVTSSAVNEGSYNIGIGTSALSENTTGNFNTAIGTSALSNNLTGGNNVAIGREALSSNTTFGSNNAIGLQALTSLVTGSLNNALGAEALKAITSGSKNTAIGHRAAYTNTSAHDSIFLGYYAKPLNNGEVNQVVIGHQAIGNGSNTVTIGNSSITNNYFFGSIDADDITIDGWGSISSSLANLDSLSSPTLQDVTDNGNTTTNILEVGGLTGSGDFLIEKTLPLITLNNQGSVPLVNGYGSYINLQTDQWNSAPVGSTMAALNATDQSASHKGSIAFDKATEDLSDIKFYNTGFGSNIKPALNISSSGDLFVSASVSSSDAYIDGWGSISESLATIESGTAALNLQDVTSTGNTTTLAITSSDVSINGWNSVSASLSSIESAATSLTLADITSNGNTSTGDVTVNGDLDADDVTIDAWGSVSSSLSSIESTATSLTLADVTANGNGSTGNVAINGDLDADDVTIDDWGSLSASLAAIEATGTAIPTLDQVVTAGNTTSGSIEVQNLTVNGTGSFAYIQSVTGSAKIIGDAYIILNADSPSERYAGIKVYDSGSTGETGSLEYDSVANHWFYESVNEGYAAVLMSGPKASRGALSVPTSGSLVVAAGNHLYSSNVSDLNGVVSVATDLAVTGSTIQNDITEFQSGKITVNDSSTGIIGGDNAASTYAGAVLDYVVYDGARNNQRTGTVQVSANTSTVVHSENVTTDIGGTDGMQITTTMNLTNFRINMVNSSGNTIYVSYNLKLLKV